MPSLRELQLRFVAALFDEALPAPEFLEQPEVSTAQRFAIHRAALRAGYRNALALDYPVIARLVGAEHFTGLARELQDEQPSRSGDLQHVGTDFPAFLAHHYAATRYACFADVALLEQALRAVQLAEDAARLDIKTLAALDPARYGELTLPLHPGCRLLRSEFPVLAIWSANQATAKSPQTEEALHVNLDAGSERLLVRATADGATCDRLAAGDYELLARLAQGAPLAEALDAALQADTDFDLAACLQFVFERGVFRQAASDSGCGRPIA